MFSYESAWHRTEKDKIKKNVFIVTVKKKKKKMGRLVGIFLYSNFNRLFSPDSASAAQVLYL